MASGTPPTAHATVPPSIAVPAMAAMPTVQADEGLDFSAVVKLFVARSRVSYKMPWQRQPISNVTGSGFLIEGRLIVSNVHVVQDATSILVRRHGSARKYLAHVLCMGWQCDLALLTVDDKRFWHSHVAVKLGGVPQLRASVMCVGYPTGGENLSITCGVVSRVDIFRHSALHTSFLTVQVDAAINSGNSGGPVFLNNEVVGVAVSHRKAAQNIGYIISIPVLMHFLNDYRNHGRSLGICSDVGFWMQSLENTALRRYHRMPESLTGVCVQRILRLSPFYEYLKEKDVLLKVDDIPIGDDGTISFRRDERIHSTHLFARCPVGKSVSLRVLRDGKEMDIGPIIMQRTHRLVPRLHNCDCVPSYFVVAGFVFQPLSEPLLLELYGKMNNAPTNIVQEYFLGDAESPDHQVVVLTQILSSELSIGYPSGFNVAIVDKLNGEPVRKLKQLAISVEKALEKYKLSLSSKSTPAKGPHTPEIPLAVVNEVIEGDSSAAKLNGNANGIDSEQKPTDGKLNAEHRDEEMLYFELGNPVGTMYHIVLDPKEVLALSEKLLATYKIEQRCCAQVAVALRREAKIVS